MSTTLSLDLHPITITEIVPCPFIFPGVIREYMYINKILTFFSFAIFGWILC